MTMIALLSASKACPIETDTIIILSLSRTTTVQKYHCEDTTQITMTTKSFVVFLLLQSVVAVAGEPTHHLRSNKARTLLNLGALDDIANAIEDALELVNGFLGIFNYGIGGNPVCHLCYDGSYPGDPWHAVNVLRYSNAHCWQWWEAGREGRILRQDCAPIQCMSFMEPLLHFQFLLSYDCFFFRVLPRALWVWKGTRSPKSCSENAHTSTD